MNFADQEEIAERQNQRQRRRQHNVLWNTLTAIFIIGSVLVAIYFALLFADPASSLNPYPPPTLPALVQLPTSTPTLVMLPPTWTPVPTTLPQPSETPTSLDLTSTLPQDVTPTAYATDNNSKYPFASKGNPAAFANTTYHPNSDCKWQGIAGQVWDIQGRPLIGYRVHLQGYYNGKSVDLTTLSGGAQAWYGESGFEFVLGNTPIDSTGKLTIQLEDQSYMAISNQVTLNTYSDCTKNLVLVNFQQVR
jgi:hypothetical protein